MASIIKTAEELIEEFKDIPWLSSDQIRNYAANLEAHITNVQIAGQALRPLGEIPAAQLAIHDFSKYSVTEFPAYARKFFPGDNPVNPETIEQDFALAWLHHIHASPHHWNHWIFPDWFTPKDTNVEEGAMEMPEVFVLEMIADWIGANKTYTGSWSMEKWLGSNMHKIRLHSNTAQYVRECLIRLGYHETISQLKFKGEK